MPTLCDDVKWITRRPWTLVINTKSSRVTSMWQQLYHRDGAQDLQDVLFHVGASDEVTASQKAVWNILDFHVSVYSDGIMIQTAFYLKNLTKIRTWQSKPLTKAAKELNIQLSSWVLRRIFISELTSEADKLYVTCEKGQRCLHLTFYNQYCQIVQSIRVIMDGITSDLLM